MSGAYHADSLKLDAICWAIVLGVVAEDGCAVEGAVIFGEVQPALEAVRALTPNTKTNDVGGAAVHKGQSLVHNKRQRSVREGQSLVHKGQNLEHKKQRLV